jgi:hypothetical protein
MATATTCRAVSGYTAGSSTSRTARVGADAASSGRASHMSARGRSAVRYVSRRAPPGGPGRSSRTRAAFPDTRGCASMPRARADAEPALRDARARARAPNPASVRSAFVETNTAPDALSIPQAWKIRRAVPRGAIVLAVQARREGATQHRQGRKGQNLVHQRGVSPRRGDWCVPPLPVRVGFFRMQETRTFIQPRKTWRRARAPPERTRAAPIERRDARVSPATHRRARFASDPRLPASPPTRRADRPPPSARFARTDRAPALRLSPSARVDPPKKKKKKKQPTSISARSTSP